MVQDELREVVKQRVFGKDAEVDAQMMELFKKEHTLSVSDVLSSDPFRAVLH